MLRKVVRWLPVVLVGLGVAIQLVPYGRTHTNPPVVQEPRWDSPRTRELAVRACYDCHSNETAWPWYSHLAPFSWSVQDHVDEGREHMNFSEWNHPSEHAHEAAEEVEEGEMPLSSYTWMHPTARLDEAEREALIEGLKATFGEEEAKNH
jgi:hypothetical protein